jgi:hypothetical protein
MAENTADPDVFSTLAGSPARCAKSAAPTARSIRHDDPLGAFRGLAFALLLEFLFGLSGLGVWMIVRRLF